MKIHSSLLTLMLSPKVLNHFPRNKKMVIHTTPGDKSMSSEVKINLREKNTTILHFNKRSLPKQSLLSILMKSHKILRNHILSISHTPTLNYLNIMSPNESSRNTDMIWEVEFNWSSMSGLFFSWTVSSASVRIESSLFTLEQGSPTSFHSGATF